MRVFMSALLSLFVAVGAHAARVAYPDTPIRESTDPARVAAVERHAAELRARGQTSFGSGTSAPSDTRQRARRQDRG
jgi:hypothetical protein